MTKATDNLIGKNIPHDIALIVNRNLQAARDVAYSKAYQIAQGGSKSSNGYLATGYFCDGELVLSGRALGTGLRAPDPSRGPDDTGTNYAALAIAKIVQSARTGEPAGTMAGFPKGEFNYRGGMILESTDNWCVYIAFSGFPEPENDMAVCQACADSFIEAMKYNIDFPRMVI